jgi:WD40 repeat protein/tetratricopeptide (TPR) repeat protein
MMGAADSFDGETLADPAANSDDAARTVGPRSPGSEPADATMKDEGCGLPTLPGEAPSEAMLAAPDPADFRVQDEPRTLARSSSPGGHNLGDGLARTAAVPPSTDRSSGPSQQTSDGHSPPVRRGRTISVVDGYEILGELGRGGMGVVYRARQVRLNRPCALKMILAGAHTDAVAAHRFRAEAQAVARLQHPNVVQIYSIGEADGLPYFELEYVEGGSLDRRLDGTPWPPRRVAGLVEALARGVAEAHRLEIVHRDLKPANVLLAADGTPKVTDFGLAKSLAHDTGLTRTDSIMGSPGYMPPEQAEGKTRQVGPLADVYALGAILYELLTGRPPCRGATILETLEQVKTAEPVAPSRLVPRLLRDVETIALKCLQKDPAKRYASAGDLAEDLRRFLANEPIRARRVSAAERYWRWARRNPVIAVLGGMLTAVLIATTAGSMMAATYFRSLAGSEFRANQKSQEAQKVAVEAQQKALAERDHSRRLSANLALDKGIALAETGEAARGLHWMLEGLKGAPAEAAEIQRVIRINLSAWSEQVHGLRQVIRPIGAPTDFRCAFIPNGQVIAVASADGLRYWDARSLQPTGKPLVFERVAVAFAFSPDGKTLITGHERGGAQRWAVTTGSRVGAPLPHGGAVSGVAFSPDGTVIVTGCTDGTVRIWDSSTGQPLSTPAETGQSVWGVAFAPDGKSILIGTGSEGRSGAAYFWDVANRAKLAGALKLQDSILTVAFNPAGTTFLTGCQDGTSQLWERETNRPLGALLWHRQAVNGALFTPDGATILTKSGDEMSAYLWEAVTCQRIGTPLWHQGRLDCMAVSPDGQTLLTCGEDQTARLWEIGRNRSRPLDPNQRTKRPVDPGPLDEPGLPGYLLKKTIVYSADRKTVLTSDGGRIARLWDTSTGQPLGAPLHHARNIRTVAFSPDGRRVATASHALPSDFLDCYLSAIQVWDAATGRPLGSPIWHYQWVSALAFSPDGRVIASGDYGQTVRFWDAVTGQAVGEPIEQRGVVFSVAYSPDGNTLAVGTVEPVKEARLWDLATGRPIGSSMPHKNWVVEVAFSPDGRVLLTRSHDLTARIWDAKTGEPLTDYLLHKAIPVAALSPDGRRLATGGALEDQARIWDAQTGQPVPGATLSQGSAVTALAFSPDGTVLGVGCKDGSARFWDVATAKPLGPPMVQRSMIVAVTFTKDGSGFLATAKDGTTRSWPVPSRMEGDMDRIALRLQVLSGMRMGAGQDVEKLTALAWDERCRRLTSLDGSVAAAYASSLSESAYHEARARDAEQDGNTFAARWHLDRLISTRAPGENTDGLPPLWVLHARRARTWSIDGRLDLADTDYSRAEQVGSRSLILDWYRHRVVDCEDAAQWQTALWYLDRCLAAQPTDWEFYMSRARVFGRLGKSEERLADLNRAAELGADAEMLVSIADEYADLGRFSQASALYAKARRLGPLPLPAWGRNALMCVGQGDRAGYRAVCRALLDDHREVIAPQEAEHIAKICALGPDATDDLERTVALARYAAERAAPFERHAAQCTLGAILYRAGRAPDALVQLNESIAAKGGWREQRVLLFQGMAHQRLGHTLEARRSLAEASRPIVALRAEERPNSWPDRLEYEILRREAESVILGSPPAASSPAASTPTEKAADHPGAKPE